MMKSVSYFLIFISIFFLGIQFALKVIEPNQPVEIAAYSDNEVTNKVESARQPIQPDMNNISIEEEEIMEKDEHFTKKMASIIEKAVSSFYNALVTILYQIIDLCF
ncbi:MAG TPA: hypothetical protein IAA78_09165 [Candidatus Avamphibacillus intestinigallinarum]|nr:hypothetical protein [Candidatus Avamphibacillus intestinigallinarum]